MKCSVWTISFFWILNIYFSKKKTKKKHPLKWSLFKNKLYLTFLGLDDVILHAGVVHRIPLILIDSHFEIPGQPASLSSWKAIVQENITAKLLQHDRFNHLPQTTADKLKSNGSWQLNFQSLNRFWSWIF